MHAQDSELALDVTVQQTWKRARTTEEIHAFLDRREQMLSLLDNSLDDCSLASTS